MQSILGKCRDSFPCGFKTGTWIVVGDIDRVDVLIVAHDIAFLGIHGERIAFGCPRRHHGRRNAWGAMAAGASMLVRW